jgi:hypothetical protein
MKSRIVVVIVTLLLGSSGCQAEGDDESAGNLERWCAFGKRADAQPPSASFDEQIALMRESVKVAPLEIRSDLETVIEGLEKVGGGAPPQSVFGDTQASAAADRVDRFETENC